MKLTQNFSLEEFTRSSTATARGIDNTPSEQTIDNLRYLCQEVLEPLRQHFGVPVVIGSGYRCPRLNAAVGGVANSQHLTGEAADIRIPDEETGRRWFVWMMDHLHFHQLIWEKSTSSSTRHWIHVSIRRDGRNAQTVVRNLIKQPLFAVLFVAALACCSCSGTRHAVQVAEHVTRDTLWLTSRQYDSVYIREDCSVDRSRDTLRLKEVHTEYRYRLLRDTVRVVRCDSIPYTVRVAEPRRASRLHTALDLAGYGCMALVAGWLLLSVCRMVPGKRNP